MQTKKILEKIWLLVFRKSSSSIDRIIAFFWPPAVALINKYND